MPTAARGLAAPSAFAVAGHPVHAALVPFPIVCFSLVILTDLAYWRTANLMWQNFSSWLLFAGLVGGVLAAVAGAIDLLARATLRRHSAAWAHGLGNLAVLVLAFFNSLVHAGDGWTAVVPVGLTLSLVTGVVMIFTVWLGRAMVYRAGIGVRIHD
ncbi:DUF2231 domain-containing protein [Amaricoccus solimangrovi]|uniref:DUF2231 domain-containing protein n=1 Tax=Amaricoccus solimangrovi TaxID=2589815 RepID=A0A501WPR5_9RHOB|nr:DUF2231 domain-containing protein [Amaricoccus solimangrovi]